MLSFITYALEIVPHSGVMRTRTECRLYSLWGLHYNLSLDELRMYQHAARERLTNSLYFARQALIELASLSSDQERQRKEDLVAYRERELEKAQVLYVEYRAWGKVVQRASAELKK